MEYAIEINGLNKKYSGFSLNNISFKVPKGCIMGFVGANGAGKTTTIKAILNLITADSGTIRVLGKDYKISEKEIKEEIGVVFDESYFHGNLKTGDISDLMAGIFKNWDRQLFEKYMKQFRLPADKQVKDFSRGMKMKLSISAALAHHPKLLILDEATSGLDPLVRDAILDLFLDFIQDDNHTVLISSHITSDLEKIADYITFINKGDIILSGEKDQLLYTYGVAHCDKTMVQDIPKDFVAGMRKNKFGVDVLINNKDKFRRRYPDIVVDNASIEEILLFETRGNM